MQLLTSIVSTHKRKSLPALISSYISEYQNVAVNEYASYSMSIKTFYKKKEKSLDISDKIAGEVARILSGNYCKNGKRIWKWEDRAREFDYMYKKISNTSCLRGRLEDIARIVETNNYLKREHPEKFKKICRKLRRKQQKKSNKPYSKSKQDGT